MTNVIDVERAIRIALRIATRTIRKALKAELPQILADKVVAAERERQAAEARS